MWWVVRDVLSGQNDYLKIFRMLLQQYHGVGGLSNKLISHGSGGWKPKMKADSVSGEEPCPGS